MSTKFLILLGALAWMSFQGVDGSAECSDDSPLPPGSHLPCYVLWQGDSGISNPGVCIALTNLASTSAATCCQNYPVWQPDTCENPQEGCCIYQNRNTNDHSCLMTGSANGHCVDTTQVGNDPNCLPPNIAHSVSTCSPTQTCCSPPNTECVGGLCYGPYAYQGSCQPYGPNPDYATYCDPTCASGLSAGTCPINSGLDCCPRDCVKNNPLPGK